MIRNRFYLTPEQIKRLYGKNHGIALNHRHANQIFLIGHKLRELSLLLLQKRLHIAEIRNRILVYGSSAYLELELKEQSEQVEDLTQLAEDWFNLLGLLREKPAIRTEELSIPLKRTLIAMEIQAEKTVY